MAVENGDDSGADGESFVRTVEVDAGEITAETRGECNAGGLCGVESLFVGICAGDWGGVPRGAGGACGEGSEKLCEVGGEFWGIRRIEKVGGGVVAELVPKRRGLAADGWDRETGLVLEFGEFALESGGGNLWGEVFASEV